MVFIFTGIWIIEKIWFWTSNDCFIPIKFYIPKNCGIFDQIIFWEIIKIKLAEFNSKLWTCDNIMILIHLIQKYILYKLPGWYFCQCALRYTDSCVKSRHFTCRYCSIARHKWLISVIYWAIHYNSYNIVLYYISMVPFYINADKIEKSWKLKNIVPLIKVANTTRSRDSMNGSF